MDSLMQSYVQALEGAEQYMKQPAQSLAPDRIASRARRRSSMRVPCICMSRADRSHALP